MISLSCHFLCIVICKLCYSRVMSMISLDTMHYGRRVYLFFNCYSSAFTKSTGGNLAIKMIDYKN